MGIEITLASVKKEIEETSYPARGMGIEIDRRKNGYLQRHVIPREGYGD